MAFLGKDAKKLRANPKSKSFAADVDAETARLIGSYNTNIAKSPFLSKTRTPLKTKTGVAAEIERQRKRGFQLLSKRKPQSPNEKYADTLGRIALNHGYRRYYTGGQKYSKLPAGVTHDAQGREVQLYRQALITRKANPEADPNNNAYRIAVNQGKNPVRPDPYIYQAKYDKGWDAYNKAMRDMKHRVSTGEANRRKLEVKAKANPFLAGQSQRVAASQKAKQKRAGTLISDQYKL